MKNTYYKELVGLFAFVLMCISCDRREEPEMISLMPEVAADLANKTEALVSAQVKEGLELSLWASDTLVQDPTAISIDHTGRLFYVRAQRLRNSEFDIRGHRDWMTASISFQSPEDRRQFLRDTFATERSHLNTSLPDLNEDGVHDWRDLTVEKEEVWWLADESGDDVADKAQLFIRDFHEENTDLANGLHAEENEVFLAVGPDLWRIKDKNGDGIADSKESISHGFAVHIGFGAHGMSGVTRGPDGRIYWGIGDIGMNVVDQTGKRWKYPNQGVIVRSEPDGSGFEVFAAGLRNTHEFVFDQFGNLISEDNDGDHPGERERLVYITNGSDGGWRINWQFGKYTDPKNNDYKVWMDERMNIPRWEGQAAYITPPIVNYVNGPTGMVYNPGSALGEEWKNHFFVAEFRGSPANSPIHAFTLEPAGASFSLVKTEQIVSGLLPAGLAFGPDGALYFSDWIEGWGIKDQGRIWKLDLANNPDSDQREKTKQLLAADFGKYEGNELFDLLAFDDMRVRSKSQFELVLRDWEGLDIFRNAVSSGQSQLQRIHGIWGIAQMARKKLELAADLVNYLSDADPEIVAQAAKMIGDVRYKGAGNELIELLNHSSLRVQFFAAEALGRTEDTAGFDGVVQMLAQNNDRDAWLRHAGILALARMGEADKLAALSDHPSRALRIAGVVALRRLQDAKISVFLEDSDEYIVTEAARGINDDWSIEGALPALADLINHKEFSSEALIRRVINANNRLGTDAHFQNLVSYATRVTAPTEMRSEALAALKNWESPSVLDRVDGRYRGPANRDAPHEILSAAIDLLLQDEWPEVRIKALQCLSPHGIVRNELVRQMAIQDSDENVRAAALQALADQDFEGLDEILQIALKDPAQEVRSLGLTILPESRISAPSMLALLQGVISGGELRERQSAISVLGSLDESGVEDLLTGLLAEMKTGSLDPKLYLDVLQACKDQESGELKESLQEWSEQFGGSSEQAELMAAVQGGRLREGRDIFFRHEGAQCVRCHTVWEWGGDAGPVLSGVATLLTRTELLEALIEPNKRIAPGYESISLILDDDEVYSGIVQDEDEESITLLQGDLSLISVKKERISDRLNAASSMPAVKEVLDPIQIRDLVEFLSSLETDH